MSPILGYSPNKEFDCDNLSPQLRTILNRFAHNLDSLSKVDSFSSSRIKVKNQDAGGMVLPTAEWGQGYPYNAKCPEIDGQQSVTGCVATAMAIVMKYNNWPDKGRGKHDWVSNGTLPLSFNFEDVEFNYEQMLDKYTEGEYNDTQAAEVAKLMQAAGAAVSMGYSPIESGAMACVTGHYLHEFFKYSPTCQYITASNFEESAWIDMIREQIQSNHPVILSGRGTDVGHAFVCDGYDSDNLLHINWGWDGNNNGYFQPFLLGGFNDGIGMVINILNDGNTKEYARCWNDYGYLWATAGLGVGFNLTVEDIEPNVPFSAVVGQISFPADFDGTVCLALVDKNENIVEVDTNVGFSFESSHDWDHIGYSWIGHGQLSFKNVKFSSEIKPDMQIHVVAKEKDKANWDLILGTIEAPSHTSVTGNKPYLSYREWNIHDPYNLTELDCGPDNPDYVLFGETSPFKVKIAGGVCYVLIDGALRVNGSEFSYCDFNFTTTREKYTIDIYANRYEDLLTRKIILEQAGTLSTMIPTEEWPLIYDLTVEGCINASDIDFMVSELYSLRHLNIQNTTIDNGTSELNDIMPPGAGQPFFDTQDKIGGNVWGLESIKLPQNLKGFERFSMPYCTQLYMEIPESVETYGWSSVSSYGGGELAFLKVNNPVPVEIEEETGALSNNNNCENRKRTVLYVPVGSKAAYESAPSWRGFKEIRETDADYVGKFVERDGLRYFIFTDFAVFDGVYGLMYGDLKPTVTIHNSIDYNGKPYPVKGACNGAIYGQAVQYLILPDTPDFDFSLIRAREWDMTIPVIPYVSGEYVGSSSNEILGRGIFIPGATSKLYSHLHEDGVHEMWKYEIDRPNKLIKVESTTFDIVINGVTINGIKYDANEQNLYSYETENSEEPDVVVEYTLNNDKKLTTRYDADFNATIPDSRLKPEISVSSISLTPDTATGVEGEQIQISATVLPEDTTNKALAWSSSDENVATVDDSGLVSLKAKGATIITASATDGSGISAECSVTVTVQTGIEGILSDKSAFVKIFNMQGMQVFEGIYSGAKLTPDYYIIVGGGKSIKVKVK